MSSLLDFPNEVLLQIAKYLCRPNDLNCLLQTNSFFTEFLTPQLHKLAMLEPIEGTPSLCWAARQGHKPLVKLLLANGVEINTRDGELKKTPLMWAAGRGHKEIVKLLLERGVDTEEMDQDGNTALIDAVSNDNIGVARLLLDRGADPDFRDSRLSSFQRSYQDDYSLPGAALHQACRHNPPNEAMIQMLLDKGANINVRDIREITALHAAVESRASSRDRRAVVELLLKSGADIDRLSGNLDTVLHLAVLQGDKKLVKLLVERGANRCRPDSSLNIPLHLAVKRDMTSITKILLEGATDAEITYKNIYDKTPMHLVLEQLWPSMVKLFIEHFAKGGGAINAKVG